MDLLAVFKRVLQRHESEIEALNKKQLSEGKRSDNTLLPSYKRSYLKTRRKYGRPTAPMDLNLKGDFYSKFFTSFFESYALIGSTDPKRGILEGRFGTKIHGLTKESRFVLLDEKGVRQEFVNECKKEFLTNFKNELFR
jgi:hypothetical protein